MAVAPGEVATGKPDRAWCERCEEAHGWLVRDRGTTTAIDGPGPRSRAQEARRRWKIHNKGKRKKA
jgi:hypothetical protein